MEDVAHEDAEEGAVTAVPCRFHSNGDGTCKYGDECTYSHQKHIGEESAPASNFSKTCMSVKANVHRRLRVSIGGPMRPGSSPRSAMTSTRTVRVAGAATCQPARHVAAARLCLRVIFFY